METHENGVESTGILKIVVTGLKPVKGLLHLALYNSRDNYKSRKNPVRKANVIVDSSNITLEFRNLPPGWYAIMFYHDSNNNGRFDTILGLPREQFGFSNNVRPSLSGAPSFDKVKFFIKSGQVQMLRLHTQ